MIDVTLNGIITLTRGDNAIIPLSISVSDPLYPEQDYYVLKGDDAVYFGIMFPNQLFENAVIRKKYTKEDMNDNNEIPISLIPEDTENLPSGDYYYQIKLKKDNEEDPKEVTTIVEKTFFHLID